MFEDEENIKENITCMKIKKKQKVDRIKLQNWAIIQPNQIGYFKKYWGKVDLCVCQMRCKYMSGILSCFAT